MFRSRLRDWIGAGLGTVGLLVGLLVYVHYQQDGDPAASLARTHQQIDLVQGMELALSTATEAEKSAVMAITDEESQTFADRARAATATVDSLRTELGRQLAAGGTRAESDLLASFSETFAEFQRIDRELLALAVENTNLKAAALAFGPGAEAIAALDAALSRILAREAESTSSTAKRAMLLAATAQAAALRIQAGLAPHIAEQSDAKMDAFEASMAADDQRIAKCLEELPTLVDATAVTDVRESMTSYAKFSALRTQIFQLSRQNTNVRSLAVSLNEKRATTAKCQQALTALEQPIRKEMGSERAPINPREM